MRQSDSAVVQALFTLEHDGEAENTDYFSRSKVLTIPGRILQDVVAGKVSRSTRRWTDEVADGRSERKP